jgi:hypothetical protein
MNKDKKDTKVQSPHHKANELKKVKVLNYPKSCLNSDSVIWKIEKVPRTGPK